MSDIIRCKEKLEFANLWRRKEMERAGNYQEVLEWIKLKMTQPFDRQDIIDEINEVLK